jgi:hypothetical protein
LSRRTFLRALGATLPLPWLESLAPASSPTPPQRMLCIMSDMGVLPTNFFPTGEGHDYQSTPYLDILAKHRQQMTVFSGMHHPGVMEGHVATRTFLSGARNPGATSFRNTISVDQFAAERIGEQTRVPSLVLGVGRMGTGYPSTLRNGVTVPPEFSPAAVYRRLFVQGDRATLERRVAELQAGRSILDFVREEAASVFRQSGAKDRERIDQFFTSVRDVERSMTEAEAWEFRPKPHVAEPPPRDVADQAEMLQATNLMYDVARLALQTDSTRIVTIALGNIFIRPKMHRVSDQIHPLTHHGGDANKIAQLTTIESALFGSLARLLGDLGETVEAGGSLLDSTMVLYGSNLSDANRHDTRNLPIILAGGGFRHGKHLAFGPGLPLANLYVSMLHRMGIEEPSFASSTGLLPGLEVMG